MNTLFKCSDILI